MQEVEMCDLLDIVSRCPRYHPPPMQEVEMCDLLEGAHDTQYQPEDSSQQQYIRQGAGAEDEPAAGAQQQQQHRQAKAAGKGGAAGTAGQKGKRDVWAGFKRAAGVGATQGGSEGRPAEIINQDQGFVEEEEGDVRRNGGQQQGGTDDDGHQHEAGAGAGGQQEENQDAIFDALIREEQEQDQEDEAAAAMSEDGVEQEQEEEDRGLLHQAGGVRQGAAAGKEAWLWAGGRDFSCQVMCLYCKLDSALTMRKELSAQRPGAACPSVIAYFCSQHLQ
jgi:hypothetical protein